MGFHTKIPIVTNGLVLYYDAANIKSYVSGDTQINNLVKNSPFQGTINNGASFENTSNGGIVLDGTNQNIVLTNPTQFNYGNEITVIVGFTPNTITTRMALFAPTGNDSDQMLRARGDVFPPYFDFVTTSAGGNNNVLTNISTTEIVSGTSYFVGGTIDTVTTRLYVNGKKESELTSGTARALWDSTLAALHQSPGQVNIGSRPFTSIQNYVDGLIHYVLFYNRTLTDSEMYQNYSSIKGRL